MRRYLEVKGCILRHLHTILIVVDWSGSVEDRPKQRDRSPFEPAILHQIEDLPSSSHSCNSVWFGPLRAIGWCSKMYGLMILGLKFQNPSHTHKFQFIFYTLKEIERPWESKEKRAREEGFWMQRSSFGIQYLLTSSFGFHFSHFLIVFFVFPMAFSLAIVYLNMGISS